MSETDDLIRAIDAKLSAEPAAAKKVPRLQRQAIVVSRMLGSIGFLFGFPLFAVVWMLINTLALLFLRLHVDAYPFLALNLLMSGLATIQATAVIIQQRQEEIPRQEQADRMDLALRGTRLTLQSIDKLLRDKLDKE